jgi:hypothetical protein
MPITWPEDYRPDSPFRPLNLRVRLGQQLAAGPLPPHLEQFVDDTVRAVAAALAGDLTDQAVVAALALAGSPSLDATEIEGRVIGGQTDSEIADAMKLPAETVAAYVAVFFDIRHWLIDRGTLRLILTGLMYGRTPSPEESVRWAGFLFGGPLAGMVAEYYRHGFGDGRRITGAPGLDSESRKDMRSVRKWLRGLGPSRDPAVCRMRFAARKKDLHDRGQADAA